MIGQTIAHYKVTDKLGEGGMGVVYRALDTHLDRTVALKVLRSEATANPERKRRFVQEAKAASALNHPNIITIYDIDTAGGVDFIAMEYVAGKTLDLLAGRKGLGLNEALKYGIQIADALAKAHAAGIVHRDLKPANVMVTPDGLVKVLDFGLAKLTESAESDELAPTETLRPHTEEGTIVGTVAYMSPEQAEGRRVDARSDIFSFGAVLYEMAAGRRPFAAETKMATLSAILREDPKPLSEVLEGAPMELDRIIGLCLRKDPARRFQHMDDVKVALEALKEESDSGKLARPAPAARPSGRWGALGIIAAAVVLLGLGIGGAWWVMRSARPAAPPVLTRLTSDSGLTYQPALSPDGNLLAYASDRSGEGNLDIWVQQIGGGQPIRLTNDAADESEPEFSPDGRSIVFRSRRAGGGIYLVPTLGGDARLVAERGQRPRFSPDGSKIAYFIGDAIFTGQIFTVPASGGQPRPLQTDLAAVSFPAWSPDGSRLLFLGRRQQGLASNYWVAPLEGGGAVETGVFNAAGRVGIRTLPAQGPATWLPDGSVLFPGLSGDSTNVYRVPVSLRSGRTTAAPERVTSGAGIECCPSVAKDGRMVFASLNSQVDIWSLPVEAGAGKVTGELKRLTEDVAFDDRPSISADGRKLAFLSNRTGNPDVWLKDLATGKEANLTATPVPETRVRISADGSTVVYSQQLPNARPIFTVPTSGGAPKNVCADCGYALTVSPDGRTVTYWPGGTPIRLFALDAFSGPKAEILPHASMGRYRPSFSPDGRWLAFVAGAEDRQVYIAPYRTEPPVGQSEWIAVTNLPGADHDQVDWSPDGKALYFLSSRDGALCIWGQRLDPVSKRPLGAAFEALHSDRARRSLNNLAPASISLSVARDKLVFSMGELTGNIWMAESRPR